MIPLPPTKYEMMDREKVVDYESDNRLKAWAEKLDKTKGELSLDKIVDELYDWTARRMMDARDNDSRADEMLLKRCAYHGLNFSAPFIGRSGLAIGRDVSEHPVSVSAPLFRSDGRCLLRQQAEGCIG